MWSCRKQEVIPQSDTLNCFPLAAEPQFTSHRREGTNITPVHQLCDAVMVFLSFLEFDAPAFTVWICFHHIAFKVYIFSRSCIHWESNPRPSVALERERRSEEHSAEHLSYAFMFKWPFFTWTQRLQMKLIRRSRSRTMSRFSISLCITCGLWRQRRDSVCLSGRRAGLRSCDQTLFLTESH